MSEMFHMHKKLISLKFGAQIYFFPVNENLSGEAYQEAE
jgi:hypothetical protein